MRLKLSEIKTKSPRVRQSQDPEKLDELAASIGAFGQAIIPVGVRKNGAGYDLVYGHRRVAAAKQAGLTEIDAIEVTAGDDMLKVFGLTENVVREDMGALDIAKALQQIKDESGWSDERVGRFFGQRQQWVNEYLRMLEPEVAKAIGRLPAGGYFTPEHLTQVKAGLGSDRAQMPAVIRKVVDEGLSKRQARHVAEEVKAAGGSKAVARILREPYERISQSTAPLPPSEVHKTPWGKPKAQDWRGFAAQVDNALRILNDAVVRLASSKDGRAVVKKLLPKWIGNMKRLLKTLEGMA